MDYFRLRRIISVSTLIYAILLLSASFVFADEFPAELVDFEPGLQNPVFTAAGVGQWDTMIRERGWILRNGNIWHLWYTGYDGSRDGLKKLGYAISSDGINWTRHPDNPIYSDHWVEDMMVIKQGTTFYMFAEGRQDQAHLLTSNDGLHWNRIGVLDVRMTDGKPIEAGPYGTPTAWYENGTWYLFYERRDAGVWLATSKNMKVWKNVQDEPVLRPGPNKADRDLIALNQIVKFKDRYYAYFHGTAATAKPRLWSTSVAVSKDLLHWQKYSGNPLQPMAENKSSGILVDDGQNYRLYTMHNEVQAHFHFGKTK